MSDQTAPMVPLDLDDPRAPVSEPNPWPILLGIVALLALVGLIAGLLA